MNLSGAQCALPSMASCVKLSAGATQLHHLAAHARLGRPPGQGLHQAGW